MTDDSVQNENLKRDLARRERVVRVIRVRTSENDGRSPVHPEHGAKESPPRECSAENEYICSEGMFYSPESVPRQKR